METKSQTSRKTTSPAPKSPQRRKKKGEGLAEIKAKKHHYPLKVVKLSIEQIIISGNSLRGVQKNWELGLKEEEANPSYSSIREWLGRVGLYELRREKEKREDWLLIIDLSIELGKEKCLVILGISQEYYNQEVVANVFESMSSMPSRNTTNRTIVFTSTVSTN